MIKICYMAPKSQGGKLHYNEEIREGDLGKTDYMVEIRQRKRSRVVLIMEGVELDIRWR